MEILQAKTDIGLIRDKNEDSYLIVNHPKNKNIKLLAVCDGMGGKDAGEVASGFVVEKLEKWFIKKRIRDINDTLKIEGLLKSYLKRLNGLLVKKYGENHLGTTATIAIINRFHTIFFNCGDSRGYIYKNNNLIQVTSDDSDVWYYYKYGEVLKDDLRYFVNNSIINSCIGISKDLCRVSTKIINNDYEGLFIFSDGVTDMITDKKIERIISRENGEDILGVIINEAVNVNQHLRVPRRLRKKNLSRYIVPFNGRDNATGIIYMKYNI